MDSGSFSSHESPSLLYGSTTAVLLRYVEEICRVLTDTTAVLDLLSQTSSLNGGPERKTRCISVSTQTDSEPRRNLRPLKKTQKKILKQKKCKHSQKSKQLVRLGRELIYKADEQFLILALQAQQQRAEILYADRYLRRISSFAKTLQVPCSVTSNEEINKWQHLVAKERMLRQSWELGGPGTNDRMRRMALMYAKVFRSHQSSKLKHLQASRLLELAQVKNERRTRHARVLQSQVARIELNYKIMLNCLDKQVSLTVDTLATALGIAPQTRTHLRNTSIEDYYNAVSSKLLWVQSCTRFFTRLMTNDAR